MAERQAVAAASARLSPVSWQHLKLQKEFNFSDEALTPAVGQGNVHFFAPPTSKTA